MGVFVPLLPTTPFLLLALYFYSRSSDRFRDWLVHHPRFGRPIQDWHERGIVRPRAKILAVSVLWASVGASIAWAPLGHAVAIALLLVALGVTLFLLTRRSQ